MESKGLRRYSEYFLVYDNQFYGDSSRGYHC